MLGNPKGLLIDNKKNLFSYPISEKESASSTFVLLFLWAVASVVAVSQMLQAKYIRYRNPSLLLINSFQAQIWDDTTEFSQSNIELPLIPSPYLWWGLKSRHLFNFGVNVEGVDPSVIGRGKTGARMAWVVWPGTCYWTYVSPTFTIIFQMLQVKMEWDKNI